MDIIIQSLLRYQNNLLKNINLDNKRFIYDNIPNHEKLTWIVWLRWTWKTTILLQKLKENKNFQKSIYFSMDNPKISSKWLFNIVDKLYFNYWYRYFYVDEIHKYKDWNQELKNIYDSFSEIRLIFSWSSSIDIIKWTYDLSRRVLLFKLPILSFREFLNFKYNLNLKINSLEDILNNQEVFNNNKLQKKLSKNQNIRDILLSKDIAILKEFREYLNIWEFPFFMEYKNNKYNYKFKIENIINKILYEDISSFYKLKTQNLYVFKEIIYFIINSKPWLFSYQSLSKFLSISSETLKVYIKILEEIWLLKIINYKWNISQETRKAKKIYFSLNNVYYLEKYTDVENIWRIRESFFVNNVSNILKWGIIKEKLRYTDKWDFSITQKQNDYTFEIWWKNKTKKQIKQIKNSFIVKDDIIDVWNNIIPLWLFWFLY